jgi:hypothetical protein
MRDQESIHKAKQMMMTSPRISKSNRARTEPTINFVYRAGSANIMSSRALAHAESLEPNVSN